MLRYEGVIDNEKGYPVICLYNTIEFLWQFVFGKPSQYLRYLCVSRFW